MVRFMNRVPAGTFLIPMLLSALIYTISPTLFHIGGVTEAFLSGESVSFIIGMVTFCSRINIDFTVIIRLLKRHGLTFLTKIIISFGVSLLFMHFFGQSGIFGISALAFTVSMTSMNPAMYISLMEDYGDKVDIAAFGIASLFSIPAFPMIVYAVGAGGQIEWMPILSTLIPLFIGMILGNLDPNFRNIFGSGISVLIPLLGWNIGQGMNLLEALKSGIPGIILSVLYYLLTVIPMVLVSRAISKQDGVATLSLNAVAGASTAFPLIIAASNPAVQKYVTSSTAQILMAAIITVIMTPILVKKLDEYNSK